MSLREYMKACQMYGCFDGMFLDVKKTDIELDEKLGHWLSFPGGDDGFCVNLLSKYPKKDIKSWIEKSTGRKLETLRLLSENAGHWTPHFIPGYGTLVRYSKVLGGTYRVTQENYQNGLEACAEYAFELAFLVDSNNANWEDIALSLGELYFTLKSLEEEYDAIHGVRAPEESDSGEEVEDLPTREHPLLPERTQEERERHLAYLQWQISGASERLVLLSDPETRAAYLTSGGGAQSLTFGEHTSALDEMDSDDDALGAMFGD